MKKGIFTYAKELLVGEKRIQTYSTTAGGYRVLVLCDNEDGQIIGQYVTPPKKITRELGGKLDALAGSLGALANYKSELDFGETFAVINRNAKFKTTEAELTAKLNEARDDDEQPIQTKQALELGENEKFFAGPYVGKAGGYLSNDSDLDTHFSWLTPELKGGLAMWLQFLTEGFFGSPVRRNKKSKAAIFRSCIFLHDAVKKELRIHVSYNMERYPDETLSLPDHLGAVSHAFRTKEPVMTDSRATKPDTYGDMSGYRIWHEQRSILAFPILDSNDTCFGVLSIDTNQAYTTAMFDTQGLNDMLYLVTKGIGRILEAHQ